MRLPLIPPTDLNPEQKPLYEDMKAGIAAKYDAFETMRDDGTILGPWSAWLHEVDLGTAIWGVTKAMSCSRHLPADQSTAVAGLRCPFVVRRPSPRSVVSPYLELLAFR
jgi:hypothetical protein